MSYHAKLTAVLDAYIAASVQTQTANEEFNAASELMDRAGANLDAAVAAEDVAFSAMMKLRQDLLDGGYQEEAPAVDPAPVAEAPAEPAPVVEAPIGAAAPEAPVEAAVVIEEAAPVAEVIPEPVVEIMPEPTSEPSNDVVIVTEAAPEIVAEGEDHFITDEF